MKGDKVKSVFARNSRMAHAVLPAFALACSAAMAMEYWTRPGLSGTTFDWTDKANYQIDYADATTPENAPTVSDVIIVHTNFVGKVAYGTGSYNLLANCAEVKLQNGARLEIEVDGSDTVATWNSPVHNRIDGATGFSSTIVKSGGGRLEFTSCNKVTSVSGGNAYDYYANLRVEGGTLRLPRTTVSSDIYRTYYSLHVADGCVLDMGLFTNGTSGGYDEFLGTISGDGMITNSDPSVTANLRVRGNPVAGYHSVFPGRIGGVVCVRPYACRVDLMNTGNTFTKGVLCESDSESQPGIIGAVDFGTSGNPSSIGTLSSLTLKLHGGIAYLGTAAQTMTKTVYCNDYGNVIDGGTNGNFTLSYPRVLNTNEDDRNRWIVFRGSNIVDCIYSGSFNAQQGVSHRIIKDGPGAWLFKDSSGRRNAGVIEVNDGTLKFESIAETNVVCSLGLSTALFEKYFGAIDESKRVGYAFQLGGTGTTGTMEYVGEADAVCTTRKFALAGDGRLKASAGALDLDGFGTLDGASATLRLAGTGTGNVIRNMTNDAGRVTLVKEDGGTWTLDGEMSFRGDVRVKGGRLAVKCPDRYSYYRFILKENYYVYTNSFPGVSYEPASWLTKYFEFAELGLFDAEGNRCNLNLVKDDSYRSTKTLAPGSFGYMNYDGSATTDGRTWAKLFEEKGYGYAVQISSEKVPNVNDESTWPMVVMRLAENAPAVASYDFVYSAGISNGDGTWPATPCSWELQGSLDGKTWVSLSTVAHQTPPMWHGGWVVRYEGTTAFAAGAKHVGLEAAQLVRKPVFNNVDTVGVAGGATLSTTDGVTIKGLSVDMAGAGTVSGFAFAERGALRVENCRSNDMLVLPGTYVNVTDLANLEGWTLYVNDRPAPRRKIHVRDGSVVIGGIGMTISFK